MEAPTGRSVEPRDGARPTHALVLAAGEGSRLRPLSDLVPKPLLPIDGEPVLGRLLGQLAASGVHSVAVVTGHLGETVASFVRQACPTGLDPWFVQQPERRGTADALQRALEAGLDRTDTMVAASDTAWADRDVANLVQQAGGDADAIVTMALLRWPVAQLPHGSAVDVDAAGRIQRVLRRTDPEAAPPGATALSGSPLYVFRAAFWSYVEDVAPSPNGAVELATALQRAIDDGHVVRAFEVGPTRDLTRPADLLRSNFPYLEQWLPR